MAHNQLQAAPVKAIALLPADRPVQNSMAICRMQWVWVWWLLVIVGALGVVGALRYVQKSFGKAARNAVSPRQDGTNPVSPYHESVNGSYNGNSSTQFKMETVTANASSAGAMAKLPADLLVEQTTRLTKISIVDELIEDLHSPDSGKRRKAIWDLGQHGDSRSLQPLADLMLDSDSKQRSLILAAMAEVGSRTLKPMNRALVTSLQDESPEVRKNAIRDLTRIYDQMAQISQMLGHAIEDPDTEVQETARYALSQMNRIRALPAEGE